MSLPSRERGLKYHFRNLLPKSAYVAPFAGAWIEIKVDGYGDKKLDVAPFAGAWIEITGNSCI